MAIVKIQIERFTTILLYLWISGIVFMYWLLNGHFGLPFDISLITTIQEFSTSFFSAPYQG